MAKELNFPINVHHIDWFPFPINEWREEKKRILPLSPKTNLSSQFSTTNFLITTILIYTNRAGITAAAGTRAGPPIDT
jgi:hypothetical protein